ncbi:MAG TPA: DUF192 domain-containing protein [Acidimicrobiales bacterium]|nr:DUF192 domain-containing protein [Acidimicrobiales bacterium]
MTPSHHHGTSRPSRRRAGAAALALALALSPAACGDDDEGSGSSSGAAADSTEAPPVTDGPGPSGPMSVDELRTWSGDAPAVSGAEGDAPDDPGEAPVPRVGETAIAITGDDGDVASCCVMVAASSAQRGRGLMEVTDLGGYAGMLFVWEDDTAGGFWMRNTPTPLSIAWYDAEGEFVSALDMEPCGDDDSCPTYDPEGPYRFALEVPQGDLDDLGAGPGSRLTIGGACDG